MKKNNQAFLDKHPVTLEGPRVMHFSSIRGAAWWIWKVDTWATAVMSLNGDIWSWSEVNVIIHELAKEEMARYREESQADEKGFKDADLASASACVQAVLS